MKMCEIGRHSCLLGTALILTAAGQSFAQAATITVNVGSTVAGDGKCSVDEAIKAVNQAPGRDACPAGNGNNDTISIPTGTFNVASGAVITHPVTITGASVVSTILWFSGDGFPGLTFNVPGVATIKNIALDGLGRAIDGIKNLGRQLDIVGVSLNSFHTGIDASTGLVNLTSSTVSNNSVGGIFNETPSTIVIKKSLLAGNTTPAEGGAGGGMYNMGVATVLYSTIENNTAGTGGGVMSSGDLFMANSTVTGNVGGFGGGIFLTPEHYAIIRSTTFTHNTGVLGGGIDFFSGPSVPIEISCSLIADNSATELGTGPDLYGDMFAVTGVSMVENTAGATSFPPSWQVANPLLGAYTSINNEPKSYELLPGSPAIDSCPSVPVTDDQRGFPRPLDGNGDGTARSDFGAFEVDPWQTEALSVAAKSSDAHSVFSDPAYSRGQGTLLSANAANDFVTYAVKVPSAGTYGIAIRAKRSNNRGRYQLSTAEASGGPFTNRGGVQDLYRATFDFVETSLGNVTFSSGGTKFFKLSVTGKNSSSSGFLLTLDYLKLTKF